MILPTFDKSFLDYLEKISDTPKHTVTMYAFILGNHKEHQFFLLLTEFPQISGTADSRRSLGLSHIQGSQVGQI